MGDTLSDPDAAWEQIVAARALGDTSGEAKALALLEVALFEDLWRQQEAFEIGRQAVSLARTCSSEREILLSRFEMWMRLAVRREERADARLEAVGKASYHYGIEASRELEHLRSVYDLAQAALTEVADPPEPMREEIRQRLARAEDRWFEGFHGVTALGRPAYIMVPELIVGGFLVVKALGPFVEEWAKALGQQFGESTVAVLKRFKFERAPWCWSKNRHVEEGEEGELQVSVPGSEETIFIIEGPLTDAAKLALIDLDLTDPTVRGQRLYWHEDDGVWRSKEN